MKLWRWVLPWLVFACMHTPRVVHAQSGVVMVRRIAPPPEYARWYRAMERCAGLRGDFKAVRWFVTPLPWLDGRHGNDSTYGISWGKNILVNEREAMDSTLVSHEALHDILRYHNIPNKSDHPFPWFDKLGCANPYRVAPGETVP